MRCAPTTGSRSAAAASGDGSRAPGARRNPPVESNVAQWPTRSRADRVSSGSRSSVLSSHQHGHHVHRLPRVRRRVSQRSTARQARVESPGDATPAVVSRGVGVVDRHADLREPGAPQRPRLRPRRCTNRSCRATECVACRTRETMSTRSGRTKGSPPSIETRNVPISRHLALRARAKSASVSSADGATPFDQKSQKLHFMLQRLVTCTRTWNGRRANTPTAKRSSRSCSRPAHRKRPRGETSCATMRHADAPDQRHQRTDVVEDTADRVNRLVICAAVIVSGGSIRRTFHACEAGCTMTPRSSSASASHWPTSVRELLPRRRSARWRRAIHGRGCRRRAGGRADAHAARRRARRPGRALRSTQSRSSSRMRSVSSGGDGRERVSRERRAVQIEAAHRSVRRPSAASRGHRDADGRNRSARGLAEDQHVGHDPLPAETRTAIQCAQIRSGLRRGPAACRDSSTARAPAER